jgi:hypothetical protein
MFIALARTHAGNSFEMNGDFIDVDLVGNHEVLVDTNDDFRIRFFTDANNFPSDVVVHFAIGSRRVYVVGLPDGLSWEYVGSRVFLETIRDSIQAGFPRYEGYTSEAMEDFIPVDDFILQEEHLEELEQLELELELLQPELEHLELPQPQNEWNNASTISDTTASRRGSMNSQLSIHQFGGIRKHGKHRKHRKHRKTYKTYRKHSLRRGLKTRKNRNRK